MSDVRDLVINLVAAVIVFVAGVLTRGFFQLARARRGRTFWGKRTLRSRSLLFVGEFPRFNHLEPSGLVGLGDVHAVHEMTNGLAALGSSFEIAYASEVSDGQYRQNMILLGGTEVNSLTATLLEKTGSGFRMDNDSMTLEDRKTRTVYASEWEVDPLDGTSRRDFDHSWFISADAAGTRVARRFRTDYGIIVRSQNPFAPDKSLVQICGLYGYGTWAGARLTFEDHFYREIRGLRNFECLFRVQVHQRHLLKTDIIVLRELPRFEPPRSRINSLRGRWSRSGPPPPYGPTDIQLPSTGGDPPAD